eukprot:scaffold2751_cov344-Prasinococcus_capsulatus_cf.AAC.4
MVANSLPRPTRTSSAADWRTRGGGTCSSTSLEMTRSKLRLRKGMACSGACCTLPVAAMRAQAVVATSDTSTPLTSLPRLSSSSITPHVPAPAPRRSLARQLGARGGVRGASARSLGGGTPASSQLAASA